MAQHPPTLHTTTINRLLQALRGLPLRGDGETLSSKSTPGEEILKEGDAERVAIRTQDLVAEPSHRQKLPQSTAVDHALDAVAREVLNELLHRFPLPYVPRLMWRGYRVTAGMAYYRQGAIGLSYRVLRDPCAVRSTLIHEYAHLLAVARHGNRAAGHGEAWQQAMRDLGQEPTVHHHYDVERNQKRQQVTYSCMRCGKQLVRSRRLPRKRKYVHAHCGGDLRLAKVERVTPSTSAA